MLALDKHSAQRQDNRSYPLSLLKMISSGPVWTGGKLRAISNLLNIHMSEYFLYFIGIMLQSKVISWNVFNTTNKKKSINLANTGFWGRKMKVKKGIFIVTYFCDQNTVLCTFWDILHLKIKLVTSFWWTSYVVSYVSAIRYQYSSYIFTI